MKKIIKHYPMTGRLIVTRGYMSQHRPSKPVLHRLDVWKQLLMCGNLKKLSFWYCQRQLIFLSDQEIVIPFPHIVISYSSLVHV